MLSGRGKPPSVKKYAGHADIEWIVVLEEVLGTRSSQGGVLRLKNPRKFMNWPQSTASSPGTQTSYPLRMMPTRLKQPRGR